MPASGNSIRLQENAASHPTRDRPILLERSFEGAVVVADMAGYTRFTERMVHATPDGIERLGRTLQSSFRDYAAVVTRHGGRIVTLAGDAIIAVWSFETEDARSATDRAVACARLLVRNARKHSLPLHAGVAAGPLWAGSCSGFERETDTVFGGFGMRHAFRAARAAGAGEVQTIGRVLALQGKAVVDETALLALSPLGDALPDAELAAEPEHDADLWNAELRDVAALFVRLLRFDERVLGDWSAQCDALLLAQETTGTSGATGRLVIDDRGLVFVAVMGEPEAGRLEAPLVIAERAGMLIDELQRKGVAVAAGLAFGRAFCGDIRSGAERWRVSIGSALNVAARVMDQTGEGLCVADLQLESPPSWLPPLADMLTLRGVSEPVRVFRYDPAGRRKREIVLFERDEELARLESLLRAVRDGQGLACLVRADAGVGKSALLAAVEARAEALGLAIARGAAQTNERAAPYFLFRRMLRDLIPEASTRDPSRLASYLERMSVDASLGPLLSSVFHVGLPDNATTERLTGRARSEATLELLFTLLTHALRRPTLLSVEDVQFADPASIELLLRVGLRLPNILLFITARPSALTSDLIYRLSGPRYHQLDLKPLSRSGVQALVLHALKGPSADSLVDCIEDASRGNALFALEYLKLLNDRGRVANEGGTFRLSKPLDANTVPSTVMGALSSRIHTLPPREQRLLKIASVLGPTFSRELLHQTASDYDAAELDSVLTNLERNGLVVQQSLRDEALGFSHDLIRDAAYDTMLFEQRRRVHAEIGRILEHQREQQIRSLLPALVHHADEAGDHERVVKYGDMAAAEAIKQGAYGEAKEFLELCLVSAAKLAPGAVEPAWYVRWHRWLAEAAGATGVLAARREHALKAVALAGVRVARSRAAARASMLLSLLRRVLVPRRRRLRALPASTTSSDHVEVAHAFHELAFASYFAGESDWFGYYTLRGLAHAEHGGDVQQLIELSGLAGACLSYLGFARTGRKYMAAAHEVADPGTYEHAIATADMQCALYFIGRGAWQEVAMHLDRCQPSCRRLGSNYLWGNAQIIRFWSYWYRGEHEAAAAAAIELLTAAERSGNRQHLCWAHRTLGLVRRSENQLDRAHEHLQIARSLLASDADLNELVQVMGSAAELAFVRGDERLAAEITDPLLERLAQTRRLTGHAMLEGLSGLATVSLQLWEQDLADFVRKNRARAAVRMLERYAAVFPIGLPRYEYWRARWLRGLGKRHAAAAAIKRARAQARRLRVAYELTMDEDRFRDSVTHARVRGRPRS